MNAGLSLRKKVNGKKGEDNYEGVLDNSQVQAPHYMEIGALAQNQGIMKRSNTLLEQAERLVIPSFQEIFLNRSWALLSNQTKLMIV